jgi:hypothetical protein
LISWSSRELSLAKGNGQHGLVSFEFEVVKTFLKWLVFINNLNVFNVADLMETSNSVLDKLS